MGSIRTRCATFYGNIAAAWLHVLGADHLGLVQDVQSVGRICREFDIPYLIDACQVAGQIPMDAMQLGCDYLSFSARKFLRGPRGIGALYVSDRALERGYYPLFVDMRGANWLAEDQFEIAQARTWQLAAHARACLESIQGVRVSTAANSDARLSLPPIPGWHAYD